MNYKNLKERQSHIRQEFNDSLGLRVHRALSWLEKAEQERDEDGRFVFLWIAFNAAYAAELDPYALAGSGTGSESRRFSGFVTKLAELDQEQRLDRLVSGQAYGHLQPLLETPHVFQPFWDCQSGRDPDLDWERAFVEANRAAREALVQENTTEVICILLSRICTLRNQLLHGGATYQSLLNRDQVGAAVAFLQGFVPAMLTIMMDHPGVSWGRARFPVV